MTRILLTLTLLLLTSCIAPDGGTVTLATIDEAGAVQVQVVEVTGEQEFYRGLFHLCLMSVSDDDVLDMPEVARCYQFVMQAYQNQMHADPHMMRLWNWDAVRQ